MGISPFQNVFASKAPRPPIEQARRLLGYRLFADLRQPHWQLLSWHRHAFFSHPQEQELHSQFPQQLDSAAFFVVE